MLTKFVLQKPITHDEARNIFLNTAPTYQGVKGLLRKTYLFADDNVTVGGVYSWNSRQEAEAMYTEDWRAFVCEKYGSEPSVTYFESPVVVDNLLDEIIVAEFPNDH